jgi:DNA-binding beta-propeller fold protein YncE
VTDAQGRVYVTDRDNQRIEVFDASGKFLNQWSGTGGISGLFMTRDQRIWTGGILRDLDGKVLGQLPGLEPLERTAWWPRSPEMSTSRN